jgi:thioredoxin 1
MSTSATYTPHAPEQAEVSTWPGPALLDFGTSWCGHCSRAAPLVEAALAPHPAVRHLRVEDGPGRRLGRQFGVTLWPTLVFLRDGQEVCRLVRPTEAADLTQALERINPRD